MRGRSAKMAMNAPALHPFRLLRAPLPAHIPCLLINFSIRSTTAAGR
jgi:hypothetical protein